MEQKPQNWFTPHHLSAQDYKKNGAYFVTICSYGRQPQFALPELEKILRQQWHDLPQRFELKIRLDRFVIMPDHVHFIVWIINDTPNESVVPSLPRIVSVYKSLSHRAWLQHLKAIGSYEYSRIWQKNYFDRIIRGPHQLEIARFYIENNPQDIDQIVWD